MAACACLSLGPSARHVRSGICHNQDVEDAAGLIHMTLQVMVRDEL